MSGEPLLSSFHGQLARQFLLVQYTSRMAEKCAQLSEALQAGDVTAVQRFGHHYKGSGAGFGYPAITAAGAALEQAALTAGAVDGAVREAAAALIALCERAQLAFPAREVRPGAST